MPAFLTHRAAGERVIDKLKDGAIQNSGAFYLGCQGPDILFFRNYMPWRSSKDSLPLGIAMHSEHIREMFTRGFDFVRKFDGADKDELISYVAGFITHYAIDKNAHPFVYKKAGNNMSVHHMLEFMWDSYTAKEQWDVEPIDFDIYSDVMYAPICNGVSDWYRAVAKDVYQIELSQKAITQAQYHTAKAKKALGHISWPKKILMSVVSRISGFEVDTMLYPVERDESIFTLEEYEDMQQMIVRGVDEAAEMIVVMLAFIEAEQPQPLPKWFGDTDFAGEPQNHSTDA